MEQRAAAVETARTWLARQGAAEGAGDVLKHLVAPGRAVGARGGGVLGREHGEALDASFVYKVVLRQAKVRPAVLAAAVRWLDAHWDRPKIDFVFERLMSNQALPDDGWRFVAEVALGWLVRAPLDRDFAYALSPFAQRSELLDAAQCVRWLAHARRMLQAGVPTPDGVVRQIGKLGKRIERGGLPATPAPS